MSKLKQRRPAEMLDVPHRPAGSDQTIHACHVGPRAHQSVAMCCVLDDRLRRVGERIVIFGIFYKLCATPCDLRNSSSIRRNHWKATGHGFDDGIGEGLIK